MVKYREFQSGLALASCASLCGWHDGGEERKSPSSGVEHREMLAGILWSSCRREGTDYA